MIDSSDAQDQSPDSTQPEETTPPDQLDQADNDDDADAPEHGETDVDGDDDAPRRPKPAFSMRPEVAAQGIDTFDDLPLLPQIREGVRKIGWTAPTPVQKLCLPFTLRGRDVAGFAQTGTGKTAVFLMTIIQRLMEPTEGPAKDPGMPRAIVLAPTRELAMQIEQDAQMLLEQAGLKSMAVFGGIDYDKQARQIKDGVDIIFATPGRLIDYVKKKVVTLGNIGVFVCDEADRMFDMGFIEDVEFFLEKIPETSQKLLFSATTNDLVKELAFEYLETPEYISVNPEVITPEKIEQHGIHCHATEKLRVILGLLREHKPECAIIFTNTKLTAEWLHHKLVGNGIEADLITGDLPQKKRIRLIHRIKEGQLKALIATDVASRGLHISRVTHVYNFDLPDEAANYVHRIGRTARAGARGFAYSLVCDDYGQNLADIKTLLGSQAAFVTEWPNEEYLKIEDKAGNPFEERYKAREMQRAGAAASRDGGRGGSRPHQGQRSHGPRDQHRDGGPHGQRDKGGRDRGRGGEHSDRPGRPGHPGRQQFDGERSGKQGGRRDRGPHQRQDHGRGDHHKKPHGGHPKSHHSGHGLELADQSSKSFFGMIMKLFKTIFGFGKK